MREAIILIFPPNTWFPGFCHSPFEVICGRSNYWSNFGLWVTGQNGLGGNPTGCQTQSHIGHFYGKVKIWNIRSFKMRGTHVHVLLWLLGTLDAQSEIFSPPSHCSRPPFAFPIWLPHLDKAFNLSIFLMSMKHTSREMTSLWSSPPSYVPLTNWECNYCNDSNWLYN